MKTFCYQMSPKLTKVVAVDPAVKEAGFAFYYPKERILETGQHSTDVKVLGRAFPEMYPIVKKSVIGLISKVEKYLDSETDFIIEYTFLNGEFSVGLSMFNTLLVDRLLTYKMVGRVSFVPPRLCSWFLKQRKTLKSEHVQFVLSRFPFLRRHLSSHEADAVAMIMAVHSNSLINRYKVDFRVPEVERIQIDLSDVYK